MPNLFLLHPFITVIADTLFFMLLCKFHQWLIFSCKGSTLFCRLFSDIDNPRRSCSMLVYTQYKLGYNGKLLWRDESNTFPHQCSTPRYSKQMHTYFNATSRVFHCCSNYTYTVLSWFVHETVAYLTEERCRLLVTKCCLPVFLSTKLK